MATEAITVPCGQCVGCRIDRARDWSIRCVHEASTHDLNLFVTLTYSDDSIPDHGNLNHKDFKRFIRRIKRYMGQHVRYFMCGEYGPQDARPHYHAILFGVEYPDAYLWRTDGPYEYFRSTTLETHWNNGHVEFSPFSRQTANYVASYIMKKQTGEEGAKSRERLVPETGEIIELKAEYVAASNRPGIGHDWFQKYWRDVYPEDCIVMDGKKWPVPRYYDKLLERKDPDLFEHIRQKRLAFAEEHSYDTTPQRLVAREECKEHSIKNQQRINDQWRPEICPRCRRDCQSSPALD